MKLPSSLCLTLPAHSSFSSVSCILLDSKLWLSLSLSMLSFLSHALLLCYRLFGINNWCKQVLCRKQKVANQAAIAKSVSIIWKLVQSTQLLRDHLGWNIPFILNKHQRCTLQFYILHFIYGHSCHVLLLASQPESSVRVSKQKHFPNDINVPLAVQNRNSFSFSFTFTICHTSRLRHRLAVTQ